MRHHNGRGDLSVSSVFERNQCVRSLFHLDVQYRTAPAMDNLEDLPEQESKEVELVRSDVDPHASPTLGHVAPPRVVVPRNPFGKMCPG